MTNRTNPKLGLHAVLALSIGSSLVLAAACGEDAPSGIEGSVATTRGTGTGGAVAASSTATGELLPDASPPDASIPEDAPSIGDAGAVAPFLGANVEPGGVVFRVWAPNATAAWVRGNFTPADIAMTPVVGGIFEVHVAGAEAGSTYNFVLAGPTGSIVRIDPYCRELTGTTCSIVDPSTYPWMSSAFARPARTDAVVYEMHVGSFSVPAGASQGTFATARAALSSLADLGVNVIELMPVQDFGSGPEGWGYNPDLYFAPKPSYGAPDDLRALVDQAHSLGIAVWLDTVINHCDGGKTTPLYCFDGECVNGPAGIYFFPPGMYATTPWGPRPNYTEPEVAKMLLASVDGWMGEFHGDGFRWDSVSNIRAIDGTGTTPGGEALLVSINDRVHALGGLSVAEDLKGYAAITASPQAGGFGFDAQWDGFGYGVTNVLVEVADSARDLGAIVTALQGNYGGDPFARLLFTEDHDTVGNGGARLPSLIDAADPTSWAARKRSMLGAVLLLTAPGVPMLFQGQEALATGTFAAPPAPLAAPTPTGLMIRSFYKDMIRLRRNLDGGAGSLAETGLEIFHRNDAAKVLGYRRYGASGEDVLVIVNLMNKAYAEYDVGVATAGPWKIRINTDLTQYSPDFGNGETGDITAVAGEKDGKPFKLPLELGAYSAMVLTH